MKPDILLAGHIVKDITPSGWRVGGGVAYGSIQARRLGLSVAAVSSCAADLQPRDIVPGVDWLLIPSEETTTFENMYESGHRTQHVMSRARQLHASDIPAEWLAASLVLLCPVLDELPAGFGGLFQSQGSLLALGAQGWLRRLDEGGRVAVDLIEDAPAWLQGADIVFVSEEDAVDAENVSRWQAKAATVVLTRASRGCSVWDGSGRHDIPAVEIAEVDPTGAGDVFATAFSVRYRETEDAVEAAHFASAAAALSLRAAGTRGIAGREEIEDLLRAQRAAHSR